MKVGEIWVSLYGREYEILKIEERSVKLLNVRFDCEFWVDIDVSASYLDYLK